MHGSSVGLRHRHSTLRHWRSRVVIELGSMAGADHENLKWQQRKLGILLECHGRYSNLIQQTFYWVAIILIAWS